MADVITKAELARELGVSRARVTQLCELGLHVRPDGKLNRAEALEWYRQHIDPWRGGWGRGLRQKQTGRRRTPMTAASMESDTEFEELSVFGDLPDIEIPDVETWRDWMNRILGKEAPVKIEH